MKVSEQIKSLRIEKGISQEELGKIVGVQRAAVQKWESGATQNLKRTVIQKLAEYFNVNPAVFVDDDFYELISPETTDDCIEYPVIGEVAAGFEHIAIEDWSGDKIKVPREYLSGHNREDFFVLKVKGDSMYPQYQDGDKVLVLRQSTMNYSGQIGVVIYDGDKETLKKVEYAQGEDWMKLVPINPNHPTIRIENEDLERCRVLGIPRLLVREIID